MTKTINGQLEIDPYRGVIYFHSADPDFFPGVTVLRICSLPTPIPTDRQLDITHMFGVDWAGEPSRLKKV